MIQMPLFPLNTVLFPGTPLSLHIFEERYKLMIGRCVEANTPFGVVLIKSGSEVLGMGPSAIPRNIGCTAQILRVEPIGEGRMNITTVGQERFRILALHRDQPYLLGDIEMLPLPIEQPDLVKRQARRLRGWVERYVSLLDQTEKRQFDLKVLPHSSLAFTYSAAMLLDISLEQKQNLLAAPNALDLVEQVRKLYRTEVTLLQATLHEPKEERVGPFSLN